MTRAFLAAAGGALLVCLMASTPAHGLGVGDAVGAAAAADAKLAAAKPMVYLSDHAYAPPADVNVPPQAGGARPLPDLVRADAVSGFQAKAYALGDEVVVAFAGTQIPDTFVADWRKYLAERAVAAGLGDVAARLALYRLAPAEPPDLPPDLKTDLELVAGGRPAQFRQALQLVRDVRAAHAGKPVALTGHSLGGGLAMYCARTEGDYAVTFNAAYVNNGLRKDAAGRPAARLFAFEAVESGGLAVRRDAVSALTRWWFGADPAVQVIDVKVEPQDVILHGLKHFMAADRKSVNWVKAAEAPVLPADGNDPRLPALGRGTPVLRLKPGEAGKAEVLYLAARTGFVSSLYVDRKAGEPYGVVTAPADVPLNVRRQPNTAQPEVGKLPRGAEVLVLGDADGAEVTRGNRKSTTWHRVRMLVVRGGFIDAGALTDDPNDAVKGDPLPLPLR